MNGNSNNNIPEVNLVIVFTSIDFFGRLKQKCLHKVIHHNISLAFIKLICLDRDRYSVLKAGYMAFIRDRK